MVYNAAIQFTRPVALSATQPVALSTLKKKIQFKEKCFYTFSNFCFRFEEPMTWPTQNKFFVIAGKKVFLNE